MLLQRPSNHTMSEMCCMGETHFTTRSVEIIRKFSNAIIYLQQILMYQLCLFHCQEKEAIHDRITFTEVQISMEGTGNKFVPF